MNHAPSIIPPVQRLSITFSAVSEKNFHFSQHTAVILPYIQQHYPQLEKEARYLRLRSLVYAVQSVDLASPEDQKKFDAMCSVERKQLRCETGFILTCPWLSRKERLIFLLLAFGLYRGLRNLFTREKR